jgi:ferredoxin-NADP reductase
MVERRQGTISDWRQLGPLLALFRLEPEKGKVFPSYKAGQYIALRRDDCRLTRRSVDAKGQVRYVPDLDEQGRQKRGPVTHSYSISSAPFETERDGYLEFYLVLETGDREVLGRLTEALFALDPRDGATLDYVERITGDFTLDKRAAGFESVLLVGTGTGLAPFASMAKQLDHEAAEGRPPGFRLTLLHANRTVKELAYHEELLALAAARRFDFTYVASVSRPSGTDDALAAGRANNVLRHVFDLPLKEDEDLAEAMARGEKLARYEEAHAKAVRPRLSASGPTREVLRARLDPAHTVVLTCGNPSSMSDIKRIAELVGMRFEKEDWKPVTRADEGGQ